MKTKQIIIIFLVTLILVPILYIGLLSVSGSIKFFIVLSESMVPVMLMGDGVFVMSINPEDIKVGDIIAFYPLDDSKTSVSHRIVEIYKNKNDIIFQTKGDNVKDKDPFVVQPKNIIGKVIFRIPYIGYLTKFSRKPILFLIFTIIPSIIIIADETRKMLKSSSQLKKIERKEKKRKRRESRINDKINYTVLFSILFIGTIILSVSNVPYISPEFWKNFSHIDPYLLSIFSYMIIQSIILLIFLSLWIWNRHNKDNLKESKKELKRQMKMCIFNIKKVTN